jgi:transcriptional regulator with XRE-family HTH domain
MISELSNKLRELRKANNLTQSEVGQRIDASPNIISSYENADRSPSLEKLVKLAYLYNCSTDYLLGKSSEIPHHYLDVQGLSEEQIQLLSALIETMKPTESSIS